MYSAMTNAIRVSVVPSYLEDQSDPDENRYVWAYHITIENLSTERVQLRSRYWHITNARGQVQEVRGAGVVGEQPVIEPGERFEYTSGTPLSTRSGIMVGSYRMETDDGDEFDIDIPAFSLDIPNEVRHLH